MGKFADRFMNAFNGGKDDDYDEFEDEAFDDEYIDEDEIDEEPAEKTGRLFGRAKAAQPEDREPAVKVANPFKREEKRPVSQPQPQPQPARSSRSGSGNEVCIFKPSSIEDSREITETLLEGKAVVINFEGLHVEISQRILDFISGSCYALDGNLQKISSYIFIATPNSVEISGDFQGIFGNDEGSFDIAGFKSPLI